MSWYKRIINYFKFRFMPSANLGNPLESVVQTSVKECTRDKATVKRVAQAFKQQQQAMQARALKAHDSSCKEPWSCTKINCFVRTPDEIVKKTRVTRPKTRARFKSD